MLNTLYRTGIVLVGLGVASFLIEPMRRAAAMLQLEKAMLYMLGITLTTGLVGLLVELVPFRQRLVRPKWSTLLSAAPLLLILVLSNPFGIRWILFLPMSVHAVLGSGWTTPMVSGLLGVVIGKAMKDE